eukprot:561604-Prymnesium_polylepis.1
MGKQAATALLTKALQRMQTAWIFANPRLSGSVVQAITSLQEALLDAIDVDTAWEDVSAFYSKWCRRADAKAAGYAGQTGAAQEAPDPRWAKDPGFEWVADFKAAVSKAESKAVAASSGSAAAADMINTTVAEAVASALKAA